MHRLLVLRVAVVVTAVVGGFAPAATGASPTASAPAARTVPADTAPTARASARPTRAKGVYRTPGYRGLKRLPRTGPAPPPPSVVLSANGWKPDVLVDAAGTAHVVWAEDHDAGGANNVDDVVRYCRLPRGATSCDNPSTAPFVPGLTPSEDYAGPRILAIGGGLVVLTFRYPAVVAHPDGATSDRTLYAFTSLDGGTTWSPPVIVGTQEPSGGAVVWGGATPQVSVVGDTQTGGTGVQTVRGGLYSRTRALVGPGDEAYSGRLALDGDLPVVAFSALAGYGVVRKLVPGGDPNDPNAWTRVVIDDVEVLRLAGGGPSGVVLMSRPRRGGPYSVRRITDGTPGPPTPLPEPRTGTGPIADLTQDESGGLHAFFRDSLGGGLWRTTSDGGPTWSPTQLVATATGSGTVDGVEASAAHDGGGVVAYRRDPTGLTTGTVAVSAFGPLAPTGRPGAGGRAGTGVPGAVAGCDRASVGVLKAMPMQGCFLPSVDPSYPGAVVSEGDLDLNGLLLRPDAGTRIVLDPRRRRIDSTGKVRVVLRGAGVDVTLLHEKLQIALPSASAGTPILDFDARGIGLAGFPIKGRVKVELTATGVRIPLSLALPGAFGGVTGNATVIAESGRGVRLDSVRLRLARAPLGPLEVRDLLISYHGAAEEWHGKATLGLPPQPGGAALGADVTFVGGRFRMGNFTLRPQFPGIAIGPNVYFTELRGGFGLDPIRITVGAGFGAVPLAPPDLYAVRVDGDLTLTASGGTVTLTFGGTGRMLDVALAQTAIRATTDGYAELTGAFGIDLSIVAVDGRLEAFIDGPRKQFGATASGRVRVGGVTTTGSRIALSSKGFGVCYELLGASSYAGLAYGDPIPWGVQAGVGCDLSPFTVARPTARAAQAGNASFTVAAGTTIQNVELSGPGGPPAVALVAPDGTAVQPVDAVAAGTLTGRASSLVYPQANRTLVVLRDPRPGTWTIVPLPASPPLGQVRVARALPSVRIDARVTRRGKQRVVRYSVRDRFGAVVRLAERGSRGAVQHLGTAGGARGAVTFTPADGPGGRREIVALVERGRLPVAARVVARYTAPAARRPARVRGVSARRRGAAVTVRWRRVGGAAGYVVRVRGTTSGRVVARFAGRRARSLRLTGVSADDGRLAVSVAARDRRGRAGPSGRARAR